MTSTDVARMNVEAFNAGDWERFKATLASQCIYDEPATQRHLEGIEQIIEANRGWKEAFPDVTGHIDRMLADDGTVTMEITWEGTQSGPLHTPAGDIPPSNRHVSVKAAEVIQIEGDKVREVHHYFDMAGLLQQIGQGTARISSKSLRSPEEVRAFKDHGRIELINLPTGSVGKGTFEPGWRWSNDVKPLAGTDSCQVMHVGYVLSGRMTIRMDDGQEVEVGPGDAFHIAPGHDAWTVGDESCVMLDFGGLSGYAVPAGR